MYQVIKRDGIAGQFEIKKSVTPLQRTFQALNKQYDPSVIELLALRVAAHLNRKSKMAVLLWKISRTAWSRFCLEAGFADVAKAYILYRKQRGEASRCKFHLVELKRPG